MRLNRTQTFIAYPGWKDTHLQSSCDIRWGGYIEGEEVHLGQRRVFRVSKVCITYSARIKPDNHPVGSTHLLVWPGDCAPNKLNPNLRATTTGDNTGVVDGGQWPGFNQCNQNGKNDHTIDRLISRNATNAGILSNAWESGPTYVWDFSSNPFDVSLSNDYCTLNVFLKISIIDKNGWVQEKSNDWGHLNFLPGFEKWDPNVPGVQYWTGQPTNSSYGSGWRTHKPKVYTASGWQTIPAKKLVGSSYADLKGDPS